VATTASTTRRPRTLRQRVDHARGDNARGDHARGDHARGDHARGDHARSDYAATTRTTWRPRTRRPQASAGSAELLVVAFATAIVCTPRASGRPVRDDGLSIRARFAWPDARPRQCDLQEPELASPPGVAGHKRCRRRLQAVVGDSCEELVEAFAMLRARRRRRGPGLLELGCKQAVEPPRAAKTSPPPRGVPSVRVDEQASTLYHRAGAC
jgi:hypothetical protein